jgi:hypothetical protein
MPSPAKQNKTAEKLGVQMRLKAGTYNAETQHNRNALDRCSPKSRNSAT